MENTGNNDIQRLHRNNLIVVWVGTAAMTATTFASTGLNLTGFLAVGTMVLSALVGIFAYYLIKSDSVKGLVIITAPAIATLVYSFVCGGNALAFLADYLFLAMTTQYFDTSYVKRFTIIMGVPSVIALFLSPKIILLWSNLSETAYWRANWQLCGNRKRNSGKNLLLLINQNK